ncbi:MAG: autotransporter domain-containing protein, partial [Candidatus Velthaea sp.]
RVSLISGALPAGLAFDAATGVVSGRATTAGTATFSVQAQDANGTVATNTYTLQVGARPDPAQDADVRGLIAAQAAALSRFATVQTDNITRHLEQIHADPACETNVHLELTQDVVPRPLQRSGAAPASVALPVKAACPSGKVAAWISGSFAVGSGARSGSSAVGFSTNGVTAGVDARVSKTFVVGIAVGGASDATSIGNAGTSLRAGGFDAAAYASYHPGRNLFFDGVVGADNATFAQNRLNAADATVIPANRSAHATFASLVAGLDYRTGRLQYAPYLRADSLSSTFDATSENADPAWALSYGAASLTNTALTGGFRAAYRIDTPLGTLTPLARLELREFSLGGQMQTLTYRDGLSPASPALVPGSRDEALSGSVGLRANPNEHLTLQLDYDFTSTNGTLRLHTLRPSINVRF